MSQRRRHKTTIDNGEVTFEYGQTVHFTEDAFIADEDCLLMKILTRACVKKMQDKGMWPNYLYFKTNIAEVSQIIYTSGGKVVSMKVLVVNRDNVMYEVEITDTKYLLNEKQFNDQRGKRLSNRMGI